MFLLCWTWVSQAAGDSWYTLLLQRQSQLVLLPAPSASGQERSRTKIAGPGLADLQSWWMTMSPAEPKAQAREEFHYHTHTESFIKNELLCNHTAERFGFGVYTFHLWKMSLRRHVQSWKVFYIMPRACKQLVSKIYVLNTNERNKRYLLPMRHKLPEYTYTHVYMYIEYHVYTRYTEAQNSNNNPQEAHMWLHTSACPHWLHVSSIQETKIMQQFFQLTGKKWPLIKQNCPQICLSAPLPPGWGTLGVETRFLITDQVGLLWPPSCLSPLSAVSHFRTQPSGLLFFNSRPRCLIRILAE